ncbi:F-box family protein [Rhynchospora pubera]|uniref:F-box family protein n=1 Tax=Rhynchospora pubera TaxID=906938 RepID=A0AAV8DRV2_9POAL|nr:F-box family protein [Rhynchospora pubera]KAJ4789334.1 F-box family protein [Rhynchospora pubera]
MYNRFWTKCTTAKRQKNENVDRMSNLPDSILAHILSFLTTKVAVQTSLLAKRYQNLWASVPVVDLDFDDFLLSGEEVEEGSCKQEEKFVKFVNGVFEHREPLTLESFNLVWDGDNSDPTPTTAWLDTVAKLKPKFLSVDISTEKDKIEVPDSVFTSELLQQLVLELSFETISPRSVKLPCLKRLTLKYIYFEDEILEKLSSGSPAIEEMVIHDCIWNSGCISSGTMKHLVLRYCHDGTISFLDILICIPSLEFLEVYSCLVMGKLKFKDMTSLVGAQIHFDKLSDEEPLFLTGLTNVKSFELVLSVSAMMTMKNLLEKKATNFPTFDNLRSLKIGGWSITRDFDLVARFLLHAPNLKKLTLLHNEELEISKGNIEISLQLGDNLDIVEIIYKKDDVSASELVKSVETHFKIIREANIISSE